MPGNSSIPLRRSSDTDLRAIYRWSELGCGCTVGTMWDVLTWHNGTLSVAWWVVLVLIFLMLVAAGSHAAKR